MGNVATNLAVVDGGRLHTKPILWPVVAPISNCIQICIAWTGLSSRARAGRRLSMDGMRPD